MTDSLTLAQSAGIADAIVARQGKFNELLHQSVMVVLLNYGDRFTQVACIGGEWSGIKDDLPRSSDIPHCPNGHVLTEASTGRKALGIVDVTL